MASMHQDVKIALILYYNQGKSESQKEKEATTIVVCSHSKETSFVHKSFPDIERKKKSLQDFESVTTVLA